MPLQFAKFPRGAKNEFFNTIGQLRTFEVDVLLVYLFRITKRDVMRVIISSTFVIAILLASFSVARADEWDDAANAVTRLSPKMFPELPTALADELVKIGCTIPQPDAYIYLKKRTGVTSGSFAKSGQKDYAVLCSRNGVSHIQVIWGGHHSANLSLSPDMIVTPCKVGQGQAVLLTPEPSLLHRNEPLQPINRSTMV
jgi:hypothetical protein